MEENCSEKNENRWLGFSPVLSPQEARLLNPLQLAYMGDTIWETMVRSDLVARKMNVHHMHTECIRRVNAAAQAQALEKLRSDLDETEESIVLRGRNAHVKHPSPRHQDPSDYTEATAFEALIGFLYLTGNQERLLWIRDQILRADNL